MTFYNIAVWGSGPAAMMAALALHHAGLSVCLWGSKAPHAPSGVMPWPALVPQTVDRLALWGVAWDDAHQGTMRHIDVRIKGHVHRIAPYRNGAFRMANLVRYDTLWHALWDAVQRVGIPGLWGVGCDHRSDADWPWHAEGHAASFLVVAEGRNGELARHLGHVPRVVGNPSDKVWTARVRTDRAHHQVGTQWFEPQWTLGMLPTDDPYTQSWVWAGSMPEGDLDEWLFPLCEPVVGHIMLVETPNPSPLVRYWQPKWVGTHHMLLGDVARCVHPMCGQGLNLACLEVQDMVDLVRRYGIGSHAMLAAYERQARFRARSLIHTVEGIRAACTNMSILPSSVLHPVMALWDGLGCMDRWPVGVAMHQWRGV